MSAMAVRECIIAIADLSSAILLSRLDEILPFQIGYMRDWIYCPTPSETLVETW